LHCVFARRNRCNRFIFSQQDASDSSAPGWFKQRRPLSAKPRRHQTALRDQANSRSHEPTAWSPLSFQGNWETQRPRNLSVPRAGQAKRQARSSQGDDGLPGAFPRNRDLDGTHSRQSQRIGSVRNRLGTWAASAGSCERKPAVTGTAANPVVRGRAFVAPESCAGSLSQMLTPSLRSLFCASVRSIARHAGPRLVQLVLYMLFFIRLLSYRSYSYRTLAYSPRFPGTPGKRSRCYAKNRRKSKACCLLHT
jgi:hypothetical protein